MSDLSKYETQRADETGKKEPKFLIPVGKYIVTVEPYGDPVEEPDDTEFGVPGRFMATYTLHLKNEEGKQYRWPFFKATPADYRKPWGGVEWFAPGHPDHSGTSKSKECNNWRWLTSFDKKGKMAIMDSHRTIQDTTYNMDVGIFYAKDDEKIFARNVDQQREALDGGYEAVANTVVNMYPRKDTAV